jgi:hypothetical protein
MGMISGNAIAQKAAAKKMEIPKEGLYASHSDLLRNEPTANLNSNTTLIFNKGGYFLRDNQPYTYMVTNQKGYIAVFSDSSQTQFQEMIFGKICLFEIKEERVETAPMGVYDLDNGQLLYTKYLPQKQTFTTRKMLKWETGEIKDLTASNLLEWIKTDKKLHLTLKELSPQEAEKRLWKTVLIFNDRNK